ncbi:MAG TPA: DNA helicase RecQ, partial [Cytophagaceae bacterium]
FFKINLPCLMLTKEKVLKEVFGYDTFRSPQDEIIDHIISRKNALVLIPTGGGKSLCFQIPAILMEGMCVVISPLIALMKDQVENLTANGVKAAFLNSSLSTTEQRAIESSCVDGHLKFLYIAPEKLFSGNTISFLQKIKVNLFAIDEAHCVSFWGHDFRPEYTKLHQLKKWFPNVPFIALTATADRATRKDITKQLGIDDAKTFISSFDRPNLSLKVLPGRKRMQGISELLKNLKNEAGIIYCLSRNTTESVAEKLRKEGLKAAYYHAGMPSDERSKIQEDFLKDNIQIICATVAFGMGIDKPNIRWVIHYNLPKNIENFYQEIGRAGRDGLPAQTILFYSFADYMSQIDMLRDTAPDRKELQLAKLERMKQYAEADICRRRILISYFNETVNQDCGNCDICKNPPQRFDGTVLAQKALSAIARTRECITLNMTTDILRGIRMKDLIDKGYDQLKTFGAGRELRSDEWLDYLQQMLNGGVFDIAYDEGHSLKLNKTSQDVLYNGGKVKLVKFVPFANRIKEQEVERPAKSKKEVLGDKLFERLRKLRKEIADQNNLAPYIIFNDLTLKEMSNNRPLTAIDMLDITGVGHQKFNLYGEYFLEEIINFVKEEAQNGVKIQGSTYLLTLELYQQGKTPEEIGKERDLNPVTIYSHLATLYAKGYDIDLKKYISNEEIQKVREAIQKVGSANNAMKPIYEFLEGEIDYLKIRIVLALNEKSTRPV